MVVVLKFDDGSMGITVGSCWRQKKFAININFGCRDCRRLVGFASSSEDGRVNLEIGTGVRHSDWVHVDCVFEKYISAAFAFSTV